MQKLVQLRTCRFMQLHTISMYFSGSGILRMETRRVRRRCGRFRRLVGKSRIFVRGEGERLVGKTGIDQSVLRNLKNANIQSIMAETGYSKWVITKAIRSECGSTVNEWIQKMRIEEAKRLLIKTGLKIYEISAQVGYASVDYFSALFREKTGVTPEQYRQNHV